MAESKREFRRKVALQEYARVCEDIRSLESGNDRVVGLAITLVGAGAALGIAQNVTMLFVLMPFAIIGVFFFAIMEYVWIFSMGGYKRHLEELINLELEEPLLLWETLVPERQVFDLARRALLIIYVVVSVGILILSVVRLGDAYGAVVGGIVAMICIMLFIVLAASWREMQRVGQTSYQLARRLHRAGLDISMSIDEDAVRIGDTELP